MKRVLLGGVSMLLAVSCTAGAGGSGTSATVQQPGTTAFTTSPTPSSTTATSPTGDTGPFPAARRGHSLVAGARGLVLFGGWTVEGGSRRYLADTWRLDPVGGRWISVDAPGPAPRSQHTAAGDGERMLLFGGYVGTSFTYGDTWLSDASSGTWTRVERSGPTARAGAAAAYDTESNLFVVFGGAERPPVAELPLSETWVFDPATERWMQREAAGPILLNEGHPVLFELAMVYDEESDRIVLMIGGHDVWVYDTNNDRWEERATPEGFGADYMVAAAYHPGLDRVVTYGGAPTERTQETWLYDVNTDTWEQVQTDHSPGPVGDHAMAYDPGTDRVYLFGGGADPLALDGYGDVSAELWAFDGLDWTLVSSP